MLVCTVDNIKDVKDGDKTLRPANVLLVECPHFYNLMTF